HVRAYLAFYDSRGALISIAKGSQVTTSGTSWTAVAETTMSPAGTVSAAIGIEDGSERGALYVDDASFKGSAQFAYASLHGDASREAGASGEPSAHETDREVKATSRES